MGGVGALAGGVLAGYMWIHWSNRRVQGRQAIRIENLSEGDVEVRLKAVAEFEAFHNFAHTARAFCRVGKVHAVIKSGDMDELRPPCEDFDGFILTVARPHKQIQIIWYFMVFLVSFTLCYYILFFPNA